MKNKLFLLINMLFICFLLAGCSNLNINTVYTMATTTVRSNPDVYGEILGVLEKDVQVDVIGIDNKTGWYKVKFNDEVGYISNNYVSENQMNLDLNANVDIYNTYKEMPALKQICEGIILGVNETDEYSSYVIDDPSLYYRVIRTVLFNGFEFKTGESAGMRCVYDETNNQKILLVNNEKMHEIMMESDISVKVNNVVSQILNDEMTEYEKVAELVSYIEVTFAYESLQTSIPDMFKTGSGNCIAQALFFKSLCDAADIECYLVTANKEDLKLGHAWCHVVIDNVYYGIDTTIPASITINSYEPSIYEMYEFNDTHINYYNEQNIIFN